MVGKEKKEADLCDSCFPISRLCMYRRVLVKIDILLIIGVSYITTQGRYQDTIPLHPPPENIYI